MHTLEKISIGAIGGLAAVCVKFLGQDYDFIVSQAANLTDEQLLGYKIGYSLLTPILMFLGAVIAWTSDEEKRMKLIALAIAAPAIITTWSGGVKTDAPKIAANFFIPSAHAEILVSNTNMDVMDED
nr:hypothetical protein [Cellvibrionaceae bacterium]